MLEGLDGIQARIGEIQSRLASLSRPALALPATLPQPGEAQMPPFAQVLQEAQTAPSPSYPIPPELATGARSIRPLTELEHPIHGSTELPEA
ncbi:MAG: hypothetical protein M3Y13_06185, partial [Armatimonadota bacterium]|nr:hypothetical protein [Armatimonadota bacterium]